MLKSPTAYTMRTSGFGANFDMFVAMVTLGRVELARELQDLQYLSEQLKKLQDLPTTAETFRDVVETWLSLFDLIPKIILQRGLSVLECMTSNKKLLTGIGAGYALRHIVGEKPPTAIVSRISEDCGAYIRAHNYHFLKAIDKEMTVVNRTKDHQNRGVVLICTGIASLFISVGTFLARIWGDAFQESKDPVFVWLVPVVVVATILTCCVISIVVYRCLKSGVRAGGYTVVSQGR
jgi:hypothetical protein